MGQEFNPTFLTVDQVIELHRLSLERYRDIEPGTYSRAVWIKDWNLLESAVMVPQQTFGGQFLYDSMPKMAAAYWHGLACNHAFQNGNKRVALLATSVFLRMNGYRLAFNEQAAFGITVHLTEHVLSREDVASMISTNSEMMAEE